MHRGRRRRGDVNPKGLVLNNKWGQKGGKGRQFHYHTVNSNSKESEFHETSSVTPTLLHPADTSSLSELHEYNQTKSGGHSGLSEKSMCTRDQILRNSRQRSHSANIRRFNSVLKCSECSEAEWKYKFKCCNGTFCSSLCFKKHDSSACRSGTDVIFCHKVSGRSDFHSNIREAEPVGSVSTSDEHENAEDAQHRVQNVMIGEKIGCIVFCKESKEATNYESFALSNEAENIEGAVSQCDSSRSEDSGVDIEYNVGVEDCGGGIEDFCMNPHTSQNDSARVEEEGGGQQLTVEQQQRIYSIYDWPELENVEIRDRIRRICENEDHISALALQLDNPVFAAFTEKLMNVVEEQHDKDMGAC